VRARAIERATKSAGEGKNEGTRKSERAGGRLIDRRSEQIGEKESENVSVARVRGSKSERACVRK